MNLDDLFPLEMVSSRVRSAVLREFQGRCPTIREMAQIPDKHLLATPGIGTSALKAIRTVADDRPSALATSSSIEIADGELLERLEGIRKELQHIRTMLKGRVTNLA